jgi:hypothetical protein
MSLLGLSADAMGSSDAVLTKAITNVAQFVYDDNIANGRTEIACVVTAPSKVCKRSRLMSEGKK